MNNLQDALQPIVHQPTPETLVALQGALLSADLPDGKVNKALEIAGQFYTYLCELKSKLTARDFSELASRLDIGAVGMVALESIIAGDREHFWQRLVLGGLGEALMVAASRQYIKAWETETGQVHTCAAWHLTEVLWQTSKEMQPDLPSQERWQAIQSLLAPAYSPDVPAPEKAVLLGRIYQILLLTHLAGLLGEVNPEP
jgi:hypothetical protein